jgi:hypothetical protein
MYNLPAYNGFSYITWGPDLGEAESHCHRAEIDDDGCCTQCGCECEVYDPLDIQPEDEWDRGE